MHTYTHMHTHTHTHACTQTQTPPPPPSPTQIQMPTARNTQQKYLQTHTASRLPHPCTKLDDSCRYWRLRNCSLAWTLGVPFVKMVLRWVPEPFLFHAIIIIMRKGLGTRLTRHTPLPGSKRNPNDYIAHNYCTRTRTYTGLTHTSAGLPAAMPINNLHAANHAAAWLAGIRIIFKVIHTVKSYSVYQTWVMVFISVPRQALPLVLMAVVLELAAASHFRGATIQWKPVNPVNFDGRVSK